MCFINKVMLAGAGFLALAAGLALAGATVVPRVCSNMGAGDKAPLYMVINLSSGKSATNYPVAYYAMSNELPCGVNSDVFKTTNLLMRLIPAGVFTMGSSANEIGRDDSEVQHQVTVTKDFYIGVFEVTQRQWELVMGSRPSRFQNATCYQTRPVEQVSYYEIRENPLNCEINPNWPATNAVHVDSFMGKMRAKTGWGTFDLPTEAQWEYACRAGTTSALNSGKNLVCTEEDANMAVVGRYLYNCGGVMSFEEADTGVGTAKVGSYLPNAWGLFDMHGNVQEWCLDWRGKYSGSAVDPIGTSTGSNRVARGGGWYGYGAHKSRSASRSDCSYPMIPLPDIGFRAAITLP